MYCFNFKNKPRTVTESINTLNCIETNIVQFPPLQINLKIVVEKSTRCNRYFLIIILVGKNINYNFNFPTSKAYPIVRVLPLIKYLYSNHGCRLRIGYICFQDCSNTIICLNCRYQKSFLK